MTGRLLCAVNRYKAEGIVRLAEYYMTQDKSLTKDEAMKMAGAILE